MDILDRLHHALRGALQRAAPPARPPTIADVYQHLVPYRAMRGELGVWELAEYEHALLRLLSGEGGHVAVLAPQAVEEFRRELASPNPILGIYRDYPGAEVRLSEGGAPVESPAGGAPPSPPEPAPVTEEPDGTAARCYACGTDLPPVPSLRFCPACGTDQLTGPCRGCGSALKAEWNFCIRCGAPREGERAAPPRRE